ncbi:hypothetical protein N2152v2_010049 [Parachlorella kessleri]
MDQAELCLLDLPASVLSTILGFLPAEDPSHFASALLACKALRQAGEAVPHRATLRLAYMPKLRDMKLGYIQRLGWEAELLALLTRKAQLWRAATVHGTSLAELRMLLGSLSSPAGSGLRRLDLLLGRDGLHTHTELCLRLPKELELLTSLTELRIEQCPVDLSLPAGDLGRLSTLPALQSLAFLGHLTGRLPPGALSSGLTSLYLRMLPQPLEAAEDWATREPFLGSERLAECTALRSLHINALAPVPALSEEQVLTAWQQLQKLELVHTYHAEHGSSGSPGFWRALPQLPCLTRLAADNVRGQGSQALSASLPSRLASLQLEDYPESALPPLPPTVTELRLHLLGPLRTLPVSPSLRNMTLFSDSQLGQPLPQWPSSASSMVGMTALCLSGCPLGELPAPLASLPLIEILNLACTQLTDLPQELACVGSLRKLDLHGNELTRVPAVLGGGAASRLEHLDLGRNRSLVVGDEGLALLCTLSALQCLNIRGASQGLRSAEVSDQRLRGALKAWRGAGMM